MTAVRLRWAAWGQLITRDGRKGGRDKGDKRGAGGGSQAGSMRIMHIGNCLRRA